MDSAGADRPQRRTALVGRKLGRNGIETAVLSETLFAEIGGTKEVGAGYTFFWNGRKSEEGRHQNQTLLESSQDCQIPSMTA